MVAPTAGAHTPSPAANTRGSCGRGASEAPPSSSGGRGALQPEILRSSPPTNVQLVHTSPVVRLVAELLAAVRGASCLAGGRRRRTRRRGRRRKVYSKLTQEEEEEEEEIFSKADAVNEEDPERDRAT